MNADTAIVIGAHGLVTLEHLHLIVAGSELVGECLNGHFGTACAVVVVVEREKNLHRLRVSRTYCSAYA